MAQDSFEKELATIYDREVRSAAIIERGAILFDQYRSFLNERGEVVTLDYVTEDEVTAGDRIATQAKELGSGGLDEAGVKAYIEQQLAEVDKTKLLTQLAWVKAVVEIAEPLPGVEPNLDSLVSPFQVQAIGYGIVWLTLVNTEFPEYAKDAETVEELVVAEQEKRATEGIEQEQIMEDMFVFLERRGVSHTFQTVMTLKGLAETLRYNRGDIEELRVKLMEKGFGTEPWQQLLEEYFHRFDTPEKREERNRLAQEVFKAILLLTGQQAPTEIRREEGFELASYLVELDARQIGVYVIGPAYSKILHHRHYRLFFGGTYGREDEEKLSRTRLYFLEFDLDAACVVANTEAYVIDKFKDDDGTVIELPHQQDDEVHESHLPSEQEVTRIIHALVTRGVDQS